MELSKFVKLFQSKADQAAEKAHSMREKTVESVAKPGEPLWNSGIQAHLVCKAEAAVWQKAADILRKEMLK